MTKAYSTRVEVIIVPLLSLFRTFLYRRWSWQRIVSAHRYNGREQSLKLNTVVSESVLSDSSTCVKNGTIHFLGSTLCGRGPPIPDLDAPGLLFLFRKLLPCCLLPPASGISQSSAKPANVAFFCSAICLKVSRRLRKAGYR